MSRGARRALILAAVVGVLAAGVGCASRRVYREGAPTIAGKTGEFVTVELAADPTTGYSWMLVGQPDPTVATLIESYYQAAPSSAPGVVGHQRWTFRLVAPGSTAITFGYGRTWQHAPAERATTFSVTVR